MGQQQLLLLVLGMVIVGIAVVAGIQAFSEGKDKADRDAAISDAMRIISDVQAWKLKPGAFGGGSDATGFTGVTFNALGIDAAGDGGSSNPNYETLNGCYALSTGSGTGTPGQLTVYETDCTTEIATVTISGTSTSNISWAYASVGT